MLNLSAGSGVDTDLRSKFSMKAVEIKFSLLASGDWGDG